MQDLLLLIFWMMTLKRRRVQCSMTRTQEHTIPKVHFLSLSPKLTIDFVLKHGQK